MKEIKYYKAVDGSLFETREKCEEYEGKRKEKIIERFKKLIYGKAEGLKITQEGSAFPLAEIAEGWWYGIMIVCNDDEYQTVVDYANLHNYRREIPKIYKQKILVNLGEGDENDAWYDDFYIYGTIDDAVQRYKNALEMIGR